jgi:predicted nucleic acid-binding protein
MEAHRIGHIAAMTSTLSIAECLAAESGQAVVPPDVQEHFQRLLTLGQYVTLAQQTPRTARYVQEMRWKHNLVLRPADSIHIATALEQGAQEFVSTDERLRKPKVAEAALKFAPTGVRFIRAAGTNLIPDHLRQGDMLNA